MEVLSNEQTNLWLKGANVPIRFAKPSTDCCSRLRRMNNRRMFVVPHSSRYHLRVADRIMKLWGFSPCLLLLTDWNILGDDEEEINIFLRSRPVDNSLKLIDSRGYLFNDLNANNRKILFDLIHYMLVLSFQGILLHQDGEMIIWLADEVVEVISDNKQKILDAEEMFYDLGIKLLESSD